MKKKGDKGTNVGPLSTTSIMWRYWRLMRGFVHFGKTIGGSLGWKVRGALDAAFEKAAYELEPSTVGNPKFVEVKTGHGYHIIMVEGRR